MTDLIDKAIDIKGKKYVLVSDRVLAFHELYPEGSITTELVSDYKDDLVVIKASVRPDFKLSREFTGYSQARVGDGMVNKTAALENCETSAVGRALAFLGIGVLESIASAEEMIKATSEDIPEPARTASGIPQFKTSKTERKFTKPTDNQLKFIQDLMQQKGYTNDDLINQGLPAVEKITSEASEVIDYLKAVPTRLDVNGKPLDPQPEEPPIESYAGDIPF